MISKICNVQLVCKALIDYGIDQFIFSPGGSSMALVHTIENTLPNAFMQPVVDERSAAYYALGVWQESQKPVAIICTSGTAVANYLPAIIEAKYQKAQILVITADKDQNYNFQRKTQIINQSNIFGSHVSKSVSLHSNCEGSNFDGNKRMVIAAFFNLFSSNHSGPVHINVPIIGPLLDFSISSWNGLTFPSLHFSVKSLNILKPVFEHNPKILLVIGQSIKLDIELIKEIQEFIEKQDVFVYSESTSNFWRPDFCNAYGLVEMDPHWCAKNLNPDVLITIGGNLVTYQMHTFLENISERIEHWSICYYPEEVSDNFGLATHIVSYSEYDFFKNINKKLRNNLQKDYVSKWTNRSINLKEEETSLSNISVVKKFCDSISEDSVVHSSIMNSTRLLQLFQNKRLKSYANIGALGIDGSLSTFMGFSVKSDVPCYLIIGELSFLYDMNSLSLAQYGSNLRILLINNGGGGEFHLTAGINNIPTLDKHISVKRDRSFGSWPEENGFMHRKINDVKTLHHEMQWFVSAGVDNRLLEVVTDMEYEGERMRKIFKENKHNNNIQRAKNIVKRAINRK